MRKIVFSTLGLAALIASSCQDHDNLYDADYAEAKKQAEYSESFPVENIDPNQDWSLYTTRAVSVSVNEDWGETYTVRVYTANPLDESAEALCMAEGKVKSGETFSTNISVPSDLTTVFVERTDAKNRRVVAKTDIVDGAITTYFGEAPGTRAASTRSDETDEYEAASTFPYTDDQVNEWIGKAACTYSGETYANGIWDNTYGLVAAGTEVTITGSYVDLGDSTPVEYYGAKLIIAGKCHLTGTIGGKGYEVIVANGGELIIDNDIQFSRNARLITMPGSKLSGNGSVEFNGDSEIWKDGVCYKLEYKMYFGGETTLRKITFVNEQWFYNSGIINSDVLEGNGAVIVNNGQITVKRFGSSGQSVHKLINGCFFECTEDAYFEGLKVRDQGQIMFRGNVSTGSNGGILNTTWEFGNSSMVQIDGEFFSNNTSYFGPATGDYALLKINSLLYYNLDQNGGDVGRIYQNLYVELDHYSPNLQYGSITDISDAISTTSTAKLAGYGQSPFYVTADGECHHYTVVPDTPDPTPTPVDYAYCYYAFEDLGGTFDFDFNDVVLKVSETGTEGTYQIQAIAAGGTLPVAVKYDGKTIWDDIHGANGYNDESVINVGVKVDKNFPTATITTTEPYNQLKNLVIYVQAKSSTNQTLSPTKVSAYTELGDKPQCLIIPAGWKWPKEYFNIIDVYGVAGYSFTDWVQDAGSATGWYKNVAPGYESAVVDPATLK
jgi:hypothetical protein